MSTRVEVAWGHMRVHTFFYVLMRTGSVQPSSLYSEGLDYELLGAKQKKCIDFWDINNQFKKKCSSGAQISGGGGGPPNLGNAQI